MRACPNFWQSDFSTGDNQLITKNPLRRLYDWVLSWANHPAGACVLFIITALDSCILLMPPYPFLIALSLGRPKRSLLFAAICSVGSLVGAIGGYLIGWYLWGLTQNFFFNHLGWMGFTHHNFEMVQKSYQDNVFLVVFSAGGLTPFPFKIFTIAAGVCHVNFEVFALATILGRSMRFFAVAALVFFFGEKTNTFIDKYFNWVAFAFIALMVLGILALGKIF